MLLSANVIVVSVDVHGNCYRWLVGCFLLRLVFVVSMLAVAFVAAVGSWVVVVCCWFLVAVCFLLLSMVLLLLGLGVLVVLG